MEDRIMSEILNKILYDPLSYMSPQRLRLNQNFISTPLCRSVVNDLIIDFFHLDCSDTEINIHDIFWLHHWYYLPQVAYLIGCHMNKEGLMLRGRILQVPDWARKYLKNAGSYSQKLSLPLPEQSFHTCIITMGYSGLLEYKERLSPSLKQRFSLSFPDCVDSAEATFTVNPYILRVIIRYVTENKTTLSFDMDRWSPVEARNGRFE